MTSTQVKLVVIYLPELSVAVHFNNLDLFQSVLQQVSAWPLPTVDSSDFTDVLHGRPGSISTVETERIVWVSTAVSPKMAPPLQIKLKDSSFLLSCQNADHKWIMTDVEARESINSFFLIVALWMDEPLTAKRGKVYAAIQWMICAVMLLLFLCIGALCPQTLVALCGVSGSRHRQCQLLDWAGKHPHRVVPSSWAHQLKRKKKKR